MHNMRQYKSSLTWILVVFLVFGLFRIYKEVRVVMSYIKQNEVRQQTEVGGLLATSTPEVPEIITVEATSTIPVIPEDFMLYQNVGYGFSFYYPKLWKVKDTSYTYEGEPNAFVAISSPPIIVSDSTGVIKVYFELCLDLSSKETVVSITCNSFKRYTSTTTDQFLPKDAFLDKTEVSEAKDILSSIRILDTFRSQEDSVVFDKAIWGMNLSKPQGWTVLYDTKDLFEIYDSSTNDKISLTLVKKDEMVKDVKMKELLPFSEDTGRVFEDESRANVYFIKLKGLLWLQVALSREALLERVVLEVINKKNEK